MIQCLVADVPCSLHSSRATFICLVSNHNPVGNGDASTYRKEAQPSFQPTSISPI